MMTHCPARRIKGFFACGMMIEKIYKICGFFPV